MRNKLLLSSFIALILIIISAVSMSVLGSMTRKGYIEITSIINNDIENSKNSSSDNTKTYGIRIRYYSNIFRNSDIYGVYVKQKDLPNELKNVEWGSNGSPFGSITTTKNFNIGDRIDNISYSLKLKYSIFIFTLLFIFIFIFLFIGMKQAADMFLFYIKKCPYYLIIIIIISVAAAIFLPVVSKTSQIYNDFTLGNIYWNTSNKIGELNLRWILLFIGIIGVILFEYKNKKTLLISDGTKGEITSSYYFSFLFIIPMFIYFIFTGIYDTFIVGSFLIFFAIYIKYKDRAIYFPILLLLSYYLIKSIFYVLNIFFLQFKIFNVLFFQIAAIVFALLYFFFLINKSDEKMRDFILILQIFIPASLSIFLVNRYNYRGNIISLIDYDRFRLIIVILMLILFFWNIISINKNKKSNKLIITLPVIISICLCNIYGISNFTSGILKPIMFVPTDWGHVGEETIPWMQFFEFRQILYHDYSAVSGLFPILKGFFHNVLLNGTMTSYFSANILFVQFFAIITIILIYKNTTSIFALCVASFIFFLPYNRTYMILPIILTLSLPNIIANRNLWLQIWLFCIFLSGLYYPLYGGALLLATIPFAIIQFILYIKSPVFHFDIKTFKFYFIWILFLIPIFLSIPLLFRMAKWVFLQASQTKIADGIAIFGQDIPEWFLKYIPSVELRRTLYYTARIMLPISSQIICIYILINFIRNKKMYFLQKIQSPAFFLILSVCIMLPATYTSTLVREDVMVITSRTGPVLLACLSIIIPIAILFYSKSIFDKKRAYILASISIFLGMFWNLTTIESIKPFNNNPNYDYDYFVPDDMELIDNELLSKFPTLGRGFINLGQKNVLLSTGSLLQKIANKDETIANFGGQLLYSIIERKASVTGLLSVLNSTKTHKFILERWNEQPPTAILGFGNPVNGYILYLWLLEHKYQVLPEDRSILIRPDKFQEIYGSTSITNELRYNRFDSDNLWIIPNLFGASINKLKKYLLNEYSLLNNNSVDIYSNFYDEVQDTNFNKTPYIETIFKSPVSGFDFDYLFLDFSSLNKDNLVSKSISIYWSSEGEEYSEAKKMNLGFAPYKQEKVLVSLGVSPKWLFEKNDKIKIFFNGFTADDEITINKLILYKRDTSK